MNRLLTKLSFVFAAIVMLTANLGAGLASNQGWYQPKVPSTLVKD